MPRYQYLILSRAEPGREAEFDDWHDNQHLADMARVDCVLSAESFDVQWQSTPGQETPPWRLLSIYEVEADDPQSALDQFTAVAGTTAMPLSDAVSRSGMIRLIASPRTTI
jgi:hypothetical protein